MKDKTAILLATLIPGGFIALAIYWFFIRGNNVAKNQPVSSQAIQGGTEGSIALKKGLDVSHFNAEIDWSKVKGAGLEFAFIKATQGVNFNDDFFGYNMSSAKEYGLKAYPYHFYNPGDNPVGQANNFLNALSGQGANFVAVDLEETGLNWFLAPRDPDGTILKNFLDTVTQAGYQVILYATPSFIEKWLPNASYLSAYPRWVAKWSQDPPASDWMFWQYDGHGSIEGLSGEFDLDYFGGSTLP